MRRLSGRRAGVWGPGCDLSRPAVAHRAGGRRLRHQPAHAPIPCVTFVGRAVESATIGVTKTGAVMFAARDDNTAAPPANTLQGPEFVVRSRNLGSTWTALSSGGPTTGGLVPPWMSVDPVTSRVWFLTTLPKLEGARVSSLRPILLTRTRRGGPPEHTEPTGFALIKAKRFSPSAW